MTEEWRPVVGYEGIYEVSDLGRVRSLDRTYVNTRGERRQYQGRIRRFSHRRRGGYPRINLEHHSNSVFVHHLVMAAFVGPIPDGLEVRHLNGISTDARLVNLAYGTRAENMQDKIRHNASRKLNGLAQRQLHEAMSTTNR